MKIKVLPAGSYSMSATTWLFQNIRAGIQGGWWKRITNDKFNGFWRMALSLAHKTNRNRVLPARSDGKNTVMSGPGATGVNRIWLGMDWGQVDGMLLDQRIVEIYGRQSTNSWNLLKLGDSSLTHSCLTIVEGKCFGHVTKIDICLFTSLFASCCYKPTSQPGKSQLSGCTMISDSCIANY